MTTALRTTQPITASPYGEPRAVPVLPVPGYTIRYSARALSQPASANVYTVPNLTGQTGADAVAGGGTNTVPTLARPSSTVAEINAPQWFQKFVATVPQITGPFSLVLRGLGNVDSATSRDAFTADDSTGTQNAGRARIVFANNQIVAGVGGTNMSVSRSFTAGQRPILVLVMNAASSFVMVDGAVTRGTTGTPVLLPNITFGGSKTEQWGLIWSDFAIYPTALSEAQAATITAHLQRENA